MVKRASVERPFNSGTMSASEFKSFIISGLRGKTRFWKPKNDCLKRARVSIGKYKCELCGEIVPTTLPPLPGKKRKRKGILVDHTSPIVGPEGFVSYDEWIERAFVEADKLQAICHICHAEKTLEEGRARIANKIKLGQ